jgi:hypothetical protein
MPTTRFICIVKENDSKYILNIYSEHVLVEKEKDLYNSAAGEIAGDFSHNVGVYTNFITDTEGYSPKTHKGILVYARFENE